MAYKLALKSIPKDSSTTVLRIVISIRWECPKGPILKLYTHETRVMYLFENKPHYSTIIFYRSLSSSKLGYHHLFICSLNKNWPINIVLMLREEPWVRVAGSESDPNTVLCHPGQISLTSLTISQPPYVSRMSIILVWLGNLVRKSMHCLMPKGSISQMSAVTKVLLTAHFVPLLLLKFLVWDIDQ